MNTRTIPESVSLTINCVTANNDCGFLVIEPQTSLIKQYCINPDEIMGTSPSARFSEYLVKEYCSLKSLSHLHQVETLMGYHGTQEWVEYKELRQTSYTVYTSTTTTPEQDIINKKHIMLRDVRSPSFARDIPMCITWGEIIDGHDIWRSLCSEDRSVVTPEGRIKFLGIDFNYQARKRDIMKAMDRAPGYGYQQEFGWMLSQLDDIYEGADIRSENVFGVSDYSGETNQQIAEATVNKQMDALNQECAYQSTCPSETLFSFFPPSSLMRLLEDRHRQNKDNACEALQMKPFYCINSAVNSMAGTVFMTPGSGQHLEMHFSNKHYYQIRMAQHWQPSSLYCRTEPFPPPFFVETAEVYKCESFIYSMDTEQEGQSMHLYYDEPHEMHSPQQTAHDPIIPLTSLPLPEGCQRSSASHKAASSPWSSAFRLGSMAFQAGRHLFNTFVTETPQEPTHVIDESHQTSSITSQSPTFFASLTSYIGMEGKAEHSSQPSVAKRLPVQLDHNDYLRIAGPLVSYFLSDKLWNKPHVLSLKEKSDLKEQHARLLKLKAQFENTRAVKYGLKHELTSETKTLLQKTHSMIQYSLNSNHISSSTKQDLEHNESVIKENIKKMVSLNKCLKHDLHQDKRSERRRNGHMRARFFAHAILNDDSAINAGVDSTYAIQSTVSRVP